ncbi:PREDICTED: uncharacterized protein LOC109147383 [Ipomoea nil]|uniref:uncharacterized protein LOC109147383 n=1 Tax=Ipomoea nil TaxID=35883 RepID=UPI00090132B4|nr:PREDICTED: uncharacterized protein LOC109147383 [Ipomoea nil]
MGFEKRWVVILMESFRTVRYHILYEQRQLGPILPGRGLRQGDPLSPYLFLLVVEGSYHWGAPPISHLLFADDCFLFLRANEGETVGMKYVLDKYSRASGQMINYDKSVVYFSSNMKPAQRTMVTQILGGVEGDTAGKYLGLPSIVGRRKKQILGFLKYKILAKVRSWNARFLSRAGREVLLKNVIQAMPSYAMMVFLLPRGTCRDIETIMNEYWWTGTMGNGKGIRWRSWQGLTAPKAVGGMGFRSLHETNLALWGNKHGG